MKLFQLKKQREEALAKADSIVTVAESASRQLTASEQAAVDSAMSDVRRIDGELRSLENNNSIRRLMIDGSLIPGGSAGPSKNGEAKRFFTGDYLNDFHEYLRSKGAIVGSALYEGSNAAGGFAVPVVVDQQIVPLAPAEMGIRRLATVMSTSMDVKVPIKATHGVAAAKAEGDGTGANLFNSTAPTLAQKTLSAFMAGAVIDASWESLQDIQSFQSFIVDDLLIAQQQYEEPKFISGTGAGEPEGVLTGADLGITTAVGGGVNLDNIYDLVAKLNAIYHPRASWLMNRTIALVIRKLQRQANLFEPVFTRSGGQDYLLGYPVEYSASMTSDPATAGGKPLVFGDFKLGYVIGDRGGSGINVKILDQPKAVEGITQLLAYRRTDGRVRRSEALKAYVLA